MAIGDDVSDLPMFSRSQITIAMSNAPDRLSDFSGINKHLVRKTNDFVNRSLAFSSRGHRQGGRIRVVPSRCAV